MRQQTMEQVCREILQHSNSASTVWAGTAYRSKKNEALLEKHRLCSKIHFRRTASKDL